MEGEGRNRKRWSGVREGVEDKDKIKRNNDGG